MMDVIWDIDGTLADASHRLHLIMNPEGKKDWPAFLAPELVEKDAPIPATWRLLTLLLRDGARVAFITGRNEGQRIMTHRWLRGLGLKQPCPHRAPAHATWSRLGPTYKPPLLMRATGDRRPSHEVKRDLLQDLRGMGYKPTLAFEDRADDARMWRSEGLLCMHVAEGLF